MKYNVMLTVFMALILSLFSGAAAQDGCVTTGDGGNWSDDTTWVASLGEDCATYPGETNTNDTAVILLTDTVTLDVSVDLASLVMGTLIGDGVQTITVESLNMPDTSTLADVTITATDLILNGNSTVNINGGVIVNFTNLTTTPDCDNPVTVNGTGTFTLNGGTFAGNEFISTASTATIAGTSADAVCAAAPPSSVGGFAEPLLPDGE